MRHELGGCTVIGPLLVGLNKTIQIVGLNVKDCDIANMAAIAAYSAGSAANLRGSNALRLVSVRTLNAAQAKLD